MPRKTSAPWASNRRWSNFTAAWPFDPAWIRQKATCPLVAEGRVDARLQQGKRLRGVLEAVHVEPRPGVVRAPRNLPVGSEVVVPPGPPSQHGKLPEEAGEGVADPILRRHTFELHHDLERIPRTGGPLVHAVEALKEPIDSGQVMLLLREGDAHHRMNHVILWMHDASERIAWKSSLVKSVSISLRSKVFSMTTRSSTNAIELIPSE
jgi:hypothetical protein